MVRKMLLSCFVMIQCSSFLLSQSIFVGFGPMSQYTKPIIPIVKGTNVTKYNTDIAHSIYYEHFLPQSRFSLLAFFSKHDGSTQIGFDIGGATNGDGQVLSSTGFTGVEVSTFYFGAGYNFFRRDKKIYLKPIFSLGIQASKPNGYEVWNDFLISGPDYMELDILSETKKTIQIVPSFGINTGIVLWKRVDFGLTFYGVLGHKYYQKLFFKYEYKGIPQKDGVFGSNGTGYCYSVKIGYRFAKVIK